MASVEQTKLSDGSRKGNTDPLRYLHVKNIESTPHLYRFWRVSMLALTCQCRQNGPRPSVTPRLLPHAPATFGGEAYAG